MQDPKLLLGIDGGGTKTTVWLGRIEGDNNQFVTEAKFTGDASNPRALGFAVALQNLKASVERVFQLAGRDVTPAEAACVCLAGAGRPEEQAEIAEFFSTHAISKHVEIRHDAEVLAAAPDEALTDDQPVACLIAGTGSLAWGRNSMGETARSGGWGYLLGDEGSAFSIGQAGLRAACRASDGRSNSSTLLQMILKQLDIKRASELIAWCYEQPQPRERMAALAPIVFAAANHQDEGAQSIIQQAAHELADMIHAVAQQLGLQSGEFAFVGAGGVLLAQSAFQDLILECLQQHQIQPSKAHFVEEPALGAIRIAHRAFLSAS